MKRISSLFACGLIALGFATSANAQLRSSALILTNSTGTVKMTMTDPTSTGVCFDQYLTLCRPGNALSTITLMPPSTNGNRTFTFPETSGEILTNNSDIDASQITNLSSVINTLVGGVAAANTTIIVAPNLLTGGDDISLNLDNPNIWTATQTFPTTQIQGNALINSINAGTLTLNGYVTTSDFNTAITNINNASANFLEAGDLAATSPIALVGTTFSLETSGVIAGTYANATVTVDAYGRVTGASAGSGSSIVDPSFSTGTYVATNTNNNNDLVVGSDRYFRSTCNGAYGLRSMTTGNDGDIVVVVNVAGFNMTITNEKPGIPSGFSKIMTNTGGDLTTTGFGSATFVFDAVANAWVMTSYLP